MKQPTLKPIPAENRYELLRDYELVIDGIEIVVPKSFRYDGASIPPAAWQLTYSPFNPDVMLPALIHDWLFYIHQVDREKTDDIFFKLLRRNRVDYLKASAMWGAVRLAGEFFWDNDEEDIAMLVKLCRRVKNRPNFDKYQFPPEVIELTGTG